jgi:hypothetical protein
MSERDSIGLIMLAAWMNVRPDQVPRESRAYLNASTMQAWQRVGEAALAYHRREIVESDVAPNGVLDHLAAQCMIPARTNTGLIDDDDTTSGGIPQ